MPRTLVDENGLTPLQVKVYELAFDGCLEKYNFKIEKLSKSKMDRIFLAVIDALPQGDEAAKDAAAEELRFIAVQYGFDNRLY